MLRDEYEALRVMGVPVEMIAARPAVSGATGRGFRRQVWGQLVIVQRAASNHASGIHTHATIADGTAAPR